MKAKNESKRIQLLVLLLFTALVWTSHPAHGLDYAIGADLSFLKQAEDRGTQFKDNHQPKSGLQIFKDHGYNWIRLRLFHTPTRLPNDLEYTIALAKEAKKLGFKFLLNYHYSDTWADPGKQYIPKAWEGMSHDELVGAVFEYTRDTIIAFKDAGEEENPYYIVEEIEIINKMMIAYRKMIDSYKGETINMPTFNAMPVENYADLPGKIQNPIIALVHPKYANETAVRNDYHVTYISGKTHEEFDLATIKFLMIVLGIDLTPDEPGN